MRQKSLLVKGYGSFTNKINKSSRMKKGPQRSLLIDRLHKGFVMTCLAITIYGTSVLAMRGYRYYTTVKPLTEEKKLLEAQNLLAEGSSENLKDGQELKA